MYIVLRKLNAFRQSLRSNQITGMSFLGPYMLEKPTGPGAGIQHCLSVTVTDEI